MQNAFADIIEEGSQKSAFAVECQFGKKVLVEGGLWPLSIANNGWLEWRQKSVGVQESCVWPFGSFGDKCA